MFLEHKRRYRLVEIEAAMREAGLQVVRGAYYFGFVFPLAAAVRLVERNTIEPRQQPQEARCAHQWNPGGGVCG